MEGASRSRNATTAAASASHSQGGRGSQDRIEQDLKQDIPYFDNPPAIDAGDLLVLGKSECSLDDLAWDPNDMETDQDQDQEQDQDQDQDPGQEDNYPDENESSVLGSDYAPSGSGSGSAANSFYQSPTPSAAGSGCDLMLRPPSSSMYHFNYRSPASPLPVAIPGGGAAGPAASGRLHPYGHSAPPGFYPNMWYPNAPYGSGSSGSGSASGGGSSGSVASGRYMAYGGPGSSGGGPSPGPGSVPGFPGHPAHLHHALHHPYPQPHPHGHPHHPQHPHHSQHPHHQHPHETMMEMFQLSNR